MRVAGAEMAQAVRVVTVERGIDPRELALVAFGGAGPLHAAAIADELGMERVLAPAASGVLSALGLAVSERRRDLVESVLLAGAAFTREAVAEVVERMGARGREELDEPEAELRATYDLRYAGQAFELSVDGEPSRTRPTSAPPSTAPTPSATATRTRSRSSSWSPCAWRWPCRAARRDRPWGARRSRAAAAPRRVPANGTRPRVLGPGSAQVEGPAVLDLPGSTSWCRPAGRPAPTPRRW